MTGSVARPRLALLAALLLGLPHPVTAQAPRPLFPGQAAPPVEPAPSAASRDTLRVQETPLPVPGMAAIGLGEAEARLGGPLWAQDRPPELAGLIARLPERAEGAPARLQRDLLLAPGPFGDDGLEIVRARLRKLLAMGEPTAALDLLAPASQGLADPVPDELRAALLLAADRIEPACFTIDSAAEATPFWREAELTCAALRGAPAYSQLAMDRLAEAGRSALPLQATLIAALAGGERARLEVAPPNDPALLPLLRRAPLTLKPEALAKAPLPVRQAIAANPDVPAGLRPQIGGQSPIPALPELADGTIADWTTAIADVPEKARGRWLALLDGLGMTPPEQVLLALPRSQRDVGSGSVDLAAWRGIGADAGEARGLRLLRVLLLLNGEAGTAATLSLWMALKELRVLGLSDDAREIAASAMALEG